MTRLAVLLTVTLGLNYVAWHRWRLPPSWVLCGWQQDWPNRLAPW